MNHRTRGQNFALVIFGELGDSAEESLKSILSLNPLRVCVAGDTSGQKWINELTPVSKKHCLCFHDLPSEALSSLKLDNSDKTSYYSFGHERFIKLTVFKWFLLHDALSKHPSQAQIIFSDLDVVWLHQPPLDIFAEERYVSCFAAIQDDTPTSQIDSHFCTGIMLWRNTLDSLHVLEILYQSQLKNLLSGNLIPDEPTFNRWYLSSSAKNQIKPLDPESYVIGHKFFHLLSSRGLTFSRAIAFHANYVIGEHAKFQRLRTVSMRQHRNWNWVVIFSYQLLIKLKSKVGLGL